MVKIFKNGELGLLWPFYLDAVVSSMLYFLPAFMIIYFKDMGFTMFQISILVSVIPLTVLFLKIPTGAIADIYGRKFVVLIGALVKGIGLILVYFLNSYHALLFAFFIIGIGGTLASGAKEAWVTDLIRGKKKDLLHSYFLKFGGLDSVGLVISGIIGVIIVKTMGISVIWVFAGISHLLSFIFLLLAEEHFIKRNVKIKDSLKEVKKKAVKSILYSRKHHVLYLFFMSTVFLVFGGVFNGGLAWVNFLLEQGLKEHYFGFLWSASGLVGIIAPYITSKLLKKGEERKFILALIFFGILVLFPIIFINGLFLSFIIFFGGLLFIRMGIPAERVFFQRFIPSKTRATICGLETIIISFIGLIALPLAGLSADLLGARYTIFIGALIMIPAAIIFYKIDDKKALKK